MRRGRARRAHGRAAEGVPRAGRRAAACCRAARAFEAAPVGRTASSRRPREALADEARALLAPLAKLRARGRGRRATAGLGAAGLKPRARGFDGVVLVHDAARPLVELALIEAVVAAGGASGRGAARCCRWSTRSSACATGAWSRPSTARELAARRRRRASAARCCVRPTRRPRATASPSPTRRWRSSGSGRRWPRSPGSRAEPQDHDARRPRVGGGELARGCSGAMTRDRVGQGFDAHRLVAGRPLRAGRRRRSPTTRGLEGHSDGDCVLHAVCDALLGALGGGRHGRHFPSRTRAGRARPAASSWRRCARLVASAGYRAREPRRDRDRAGARARPAPRRDARRRSRGLLGAPRDAVSVKAKSADGLGAIGRGEGIAAQAVALLRRKRTETAP